MNNEKEAENKREHDAVGVMIDFLFRRCHRVTVSDAASLLSLRFSAVFQRFPAFS